MANRYSQIKTLRLLCVCHTHSTNACFAPTRLLIVKPERTVSVCLVCLPFQHFNSIQFANDSTSLLIHVRHKKKNKRSKVNPDLCTYSSNVIFRVHSFVSYCTIPNTVLLTMFHASSLCDLKLRSLL